MGSQESKLHLGRSLWNILLWLLQGTAQSCVSCFCWGSCSIFHSFSCSLSQGLNTWWCTSTERMNGKLLSSVPYHFLQCLEDSLFRDISGRIGPLTKLLSSYNCIGSMRSHENGFCLTISFGCHPPFPWECSGMIHSNTRKANKLFHFWSKE